MLQTGTPEQFKWLLSIVKFLLLLNLLDAVFTILWVSTGLAREANLLLNELIRIHPLLFAFIKLMLVSLGSLLLWRYRYKPLAVIAITIAFIIYYCILLYHISYFSHIVSIMFLS